MIKRMDWAFIDILMELFTKESGSKINNMEKELKVGLMGQSMRDTIEMEKRMVRAHSTLLTEAFLLANFLQTR